MTEPIALPTLANSAKRTCPQCGGAQVTTTIRDHVLEHGSGKSVVTVTAKIPVSHCGICDWHFIGHDGEVLMHEALCTYFGVLNPREIKDLREQHDMSRREFAELTGLGEASLSRWESGSSIQSFANDRYLRLLQDPRVLRTLEQRVSQTKVSRYSPLNQLVHFRGLKQEDSARLARQRSAFLLREPLD